MDSVSKERRREIMQKIGRRDTPPETAVRRCLHAMGHRFRLHAKALPGKPDVVLPKWKTAIFVHGCFWHGCPNCFRGHRIPKTNQEYWLNKIERNQARNRRVTAELMQMGWSVLQVWECQTGNAAALADLLNQSFRGINLKASPTGEPAIEQCAPSSGRSRMFSGFEADERWPSR